MLDPRQLMHAMPLSLWAEWFAYAKLEGWFGPGEALARDLNAAHQAMWTAFPYINEADRKPEKFLPPGRYKEEYEPWGVFDTSEPTFTVDE